MGSGMQPEDAFEGIIASLYEAMLDDAHWPETCTLIDEACRIAGTALVVGDRSGGPGHIHFARYLHRGKIQHERAREYFDVWHPKDSSMRRLMAAPENRQRRRETAEAVRAIAGSDMSAGWPRSPT